MPAFTASGGCSAILAYDIGVGVDLRRAESLSAQVEGFDSVVERKPPPRYLNFKEEPLRLRFKIDPVSVGSFSTTPTVEVVVFAFGAVSVIYTFPVSGPLAEWVYLSSVLYDSPALPAHSRGLVKKLMDGILPSIDKPEIADSVEDYTIFHLARAEGSNPVPEAATGGEGLPTSDFVASNRQLLAQILRSETQPIGPDEVNEALGSRIAYGESDEAIVGWNGAVLIRHPDAEDVQSVLEYANIQLLKLRRVDDQLDRALAHAYEAVGRSESGGWRRSYPLIPDREARAVSRLQMESAILYEGVANALKLAGDPYLARLYRMAGQRMHLSEWDSSISRKLQTADGIYSKLSDRAAIRRLELLEWIVIVLIGVSILTVFV